VAADFPVEQLTLESHRYFVVLVLVSLGVTLFFAFFHWFIVHRIVVRPVNQMARAIRAFMVNDTQQENLRLTQTSSLASLSVQTGDELQFLSDSLKDMEKKIWEYIRNLNEANQKASTDVLTQLHNREAFYNNVNLFLFRNRLPNQLHSFIMLDIDYFKDVNDTYGHAMGDEILKRCAQALSAIFRRTDEVARIGGDEFTMFCINIGSVELIKKKAQQIKEAFARIKPQENAEGIRASMGIVLLSDELVHYEDLFQKADTALYHVKAGGRNGYLIEHI
jgi:diguanylate cyclase (GGDEF)-like protein